MLICKDTQLLISNLLKNKNMLYTYYCQKGDFKK